MTVSLSKRCKVCGETKPKDQFYRHAKVWDGHLNECKECTKARVAAYRQSNAGRELEARKYAKDKADGKRRARAYIINGVQRGTITRQPCEVCGEPNGQAHHDDYSKPLEVRWLCAKHHAEVHVQLRKVSA